MARGVIEGTTEGGKDVLHPMSDSVGGFGVFQESCPMAGRISKEQMEKIAVSDGHCGLLDYSGFWQEVEPHTLR